MSKHFCIRFLFSLLVFPVCIMSTAGVSAAEFFVSPDGSNDNPGISPDQPYRTLKRAADMMKPGDTMTLLPGEYQQGLEWNFKGGDARTTIRAAIPGTAVLRGDVDAPAFTQSACSPRIWQCPFPTLPEAVNERDTLLVYTRVPSIAELDFTQKGWVYDEKKRTLFVHTSDSAPPDSHYLTISNRRSHGILLNGRSVRNVTIEGLVITGFNANSPGGLPGHNAKWGVYLTAPQNCTVRNVTAFLNGGGIGFSAASTDSAIENCRSYANGSPFFSSGGNIIILTPSRKTAIRNCISFDSPGAGIRFYGGVPAEHCIFEDNISFDNGYGDMWLKYPSDTTTARRCVAGKALYSRLIENCLFDYGDTGYFGAAKNSIIRPREKNFREDLEFADPVNHDYRPQADSRCRDRAPAPFSPDVCYVKRDGDDTRSGNSVRDAWKTLSGKLRSGATYYLLPGSDLKNLNLKDLKNVTIRGRGPFPVRTGGDIRIENCENITLERLECEALEAVGTKKITLRQSAFHGPCILRGTPDAQIAHCVLNGVTLTDSPGALIFADIFASGKISGSSAPRWAAYNTYARNLPADAVHSFQAEPEFGKDMTLRNAVLFNGRSMDGMPIGPWRRQAPAAELKLTGPLSLPGTATTANLEFRTNYPADGTFQYGSDPARLKKMPLRPNGTFHSVSLCGLKPGRKYYYKISAAANVRSHFSNQELSGSLRSARRTLSTELLNFTTPERKHTEKTRHVALSGDDRNPGTEEQPWRTISHAAAQAVAGDTVLVHGGSYRETVRLRTTGDVKAPLIFRAAPGEKVWIDGAKLLTFGFTAAGKHHLTLDGFYFRNIRSTEGAGVALRDCVDIHLERCFYDGRADMYTPRFIHAVNCRNLTVSNSFITRAFHGAVFENCPNLLIRNCVFFSNQITSCIIYNKAKEQAVLRNNIWVDNTLQKVGNPLLILTDAAALKESDNGFLLRVSENEKPLIGYNCFQGKKLPMNSKGEVLDRQWRRQGRSGNEMATYSDFLKRTNRTGSALFTDPQFPALPEFIRFRNLADWEKNYSRMGSRHREKEYHLRNGKYEELDFSDFRARNPELIRRGIGLEAEVFEQESADGK